MAPSHKCGLTPQRCATASWWNLAQGPINAEGYGDECWPVNRKHIKDLLHQTDGLLPNSWLELQAIRNDLQWHGKTFEVAHYGVDPGLFLDPDPNTFRKATGINTPFVLQSGRIEPAKKQAMLCWALRETNFKIVLIGDPSTGLPMQISAKESW